MNINHVLLSKCIVYLHLLSCLTPIAIFSESKGFIISRILNFSDRLIDVTDSIVGNLNLLLCSLSI